MLVLVQWLDFIIELVIAAGTPPRIELTLRRTQAVLREVVSNWDHIVAWAEVAVPDPEEYMQLD